MGRPFNNHWYFTVVPFGGLPILAVSVLGRLEIQLFIVGEVSDLSRILGPPTGAEADKFGKAGRELGCASAIGVLKAETGNKPKISKVAEPMASCFLKRVPYSLTCLLILRIPRLAFYCMRTSLCSCLKVFLV